MKSFILRDLQGYGSLSEAKAAAAAESMNFAYLPEGKQSWTDIKLLAMDMDSTLINIECIDEIASVAGRGDAIAQITEATMRGEIRDFKESLRRRVGMLKGVHRDVLYEVLEKRLRLNVGALELLKAAQDAGVHTLLVSGGFTFFTSALQKRLGLSEVHSNELEFDSEGYMTGEVLCDIVDGAAKARYFIEAREKLGASRNQCIAMGDGTNDLLMMREAYYAVAFHAKPAVQHSDDVNCCINFGGLDAVLDWVER